MPQVKPMTVEQAQRLALASGAKLRIAGRTFNAGMEREDLAGEVQQPAPEPAPGAEMPEAQPQQDIAASLEAIAGAMASSVERSADGMASLMSQLKQLQAPQGKPTAYKFTITRNLKTGYMEEIIATPIATQPEN